MKGTLKLLNRMVKAGVIRQYAIGGAVAAIYYLEPFATADLYIFVQIDTSESELLILAPIYEYLRKQGFNPRASSYTLKVFRCSFCRSLIRLRKRPWSKRMQYLSRV